MRRLALLQLLLAGACDGRLGPAAEPPGEPACALQPGPPRLWRLTGPQVLEGFTAFLSGRRPATQLRLPGTLQTPFVEVPAGDRFTSLDTPALTGVELEAWLASTREVARAALTELKKNRSLCVSQSYRPSIAACLESITRLMGPRAWDRPLTTDEVQLVVQAGLALQDVSADEAMLTSLQRLLMSPHFAFRVEPQGALSGHELARSLAYALTDGPPDEPLLAKAASGALDDSRELAAEVERLVSSPRGLDTGVRFVHELFRLELIRSVAKDNAPNHKPDDLLADSRAMARRWLTQERPFEQLLSSREVMASGRTQWSWNLTQVMGTTPTLVEAPGRFGMLSHPAWLAGHSHNDSTDPVRRGKFVMESLLCVSVPPLPIEMVPPLPDLGPSATVRDRLAVHSQGTCAGCHALMDPIGLGLEGFDHFGRTRSMEAGKPVDTRGVLAASDVEGPFKGVGELSARLASSPQVKACLTRQLATFALGRLPTSDADQCLLERSTRALEARGALHDVLHTLYDARTTRERAVQP